MKGAGHLAALLLTRRTLLRGEVDGRDAQVVGEVGVGAGAREQEARALHEAAAEGGPLGVAALLGPPEGEENREGNGDYGAAMFLWHIPLLKILGLRVKGENIPSRMYSSYSSEKSHRPS